MKVIVQSLILSKNIALPFFLKDASNPSYLFEATNITKTD